jgi:signal transduction histidine kinase
VPPVSDDMARQRNDARAQAADPSALAATIRVFEAALDHMDQGLVVLDPQHRVSLWNKRYETLWAFPPGLLRVGVPLADLIRFDVERRRLDPVQSEQLLRQRLARSANFTPTTEVEIPDLDRILRIDHHPLPDGGSVATFTDVTAARRQTEALAASEARFAAYARMSADWVWEQDADLRFIFVSRPPKVELEIFPGTNVGKRRDELDIVIEDQQAWRRHLDDLAARRPFRHFAYGRRDSDGQLRSILISGDPIFAADGAFLGYRGTGTDVTVERQALQRAQAAEAAAESARARLMTALEAITQGFALFDAEDRLVTCNRQYLERTTLDIRQLVGTRFEDMLRGNLAAGWRGYLPGGETTSSPEDWLAWRMAMRRNPPPQPFVYRGADGRWWMISEKRTSDGGTVALRVNVTELKETELQLRTARDEAEAASRAKNEFLASMSHELRTPLNAIMGFAEILKDEMFGSLGGDRYRGYAENIHASASYLMDLIRDVLDMSKIEAGRMALAIEAIDVMGEIDRCLGMIAGSAQSAGLVVETRSAENSPKVRADSRALRQILLNLLSNAVKFTPSGGLVRVLVTFDGEWVRIAVSDTGVGIPAWALPRLGRPFEQVDNVLQRKRPGSGLGLALSRSLAELMSGKLVIESAEGRGTTVTLSLPRGSA